MSAHPLPDPALLFLRQGVPLAPIEIVTPPFQLPHNSSDRSRDLASPRQQSTNVYLDEGEVWVTSLFLLLVPEEKNRS